MGLYCLTELGSFWVAATLSSLDCVKWTLLSWALQSSFNVLTYDIFPWVLVAEPLTLHYWYFPPCRRTSILSAASLFPQGSEMTVVLFWVWYREPVISVILFCEASRQQRAGSLICSHQNRLRSQGSIWEIPGGSQNDRVRWVVCLILQFTIRSP